MKCNSTRSREDNLIVTILKLAVQVLVYESLSTMTLMVLRDALGYQPENGGFVQF